MRIPLPSNRATWAVLLGIVLVGCRRPLPDAAAGPDTPPPDTAGEATGGPTVDCPDRTWYIDEDGDGWGSGVVDDCPPVVGSVPRGGDCDDGDTEVHPDAEDSDCLGARDMNCDGSVATEDADGDGSVACEDCDDSRADVHTEADETWGDGDDADCDGAADAVSADDADTILRGRPYPQVVGLAIGAGDVDGDGLGDVLVGGDGRTDSRGVVWVVPGPILGDVPIADVAVATIRGSIDDGLLGGSAVAAADVDADGLDDVIVGVGGPGTDNGMVGVYHAPLVGALSEADTDTWWTGETSYAAGRALANAGDVDGDGREDVLIGSAANAAYLLLDADLDREGSLAEASLRLATEDRTMLYQMTDVARAGDTDGDGVPDLLIGSTDDTDGGWRAGAAWIVSGDARGDLSLADADAKLIGEIAWDWAGYSVDGAGDANGDGRDDVLVTTGYRQPGRTYLVYGGVSGTLDLSMADARWETPAGAYGQVAGLGDVDGDSFPDIAIGDPYDGTVGFGAGAVRIVYAPGPGVHDFTWGCGVIYAFAEGDAAGVALGALGDIDLDGHADLAVGLPYAGSAEGAVVIFHGG